MGLLQAVGDYLGLMRRFRSLSQRQITQYQENEVVRLVDFARKESPFYRSLYEGLDVHSLSDFALLPTINKQTMMENFDELNTEGLVLSEVMEYAVQKELAKDYLGYYKDRFVIGLSSGTSGNKGLYVTSRELTARASAVFLARGGLPLSLLPFRILFLLRVFSQGFSDINAPGIALKYMSTMTPPHKLIEAANTMRANVIMGPPSLLRLLAPLARQLNKKPKRVVSYAEVLESEEKERLSTAFGCPVVEIYQTSEGQIASACKYGTLHINEDLVYVELLDEEGQPEQPGHRARRMLVTNLVNISQPLIRYEMNDIIELGEPCPCGSNFRTIARVVGRNDDVLWVANHDSTLSPLFPDLVSRWIITTSDSIREFQVRQSNVDKISIVLDIISHADALEIADALRRRFAQELEALHLVCEVEIAIEEIPLPSDSSKMKRFLSEVKGP
ncbi:MAG: hypothetical protein Q8N36_05250 [bacterium]|nr:hypothetical protein [bacterium]